MATPLPDDLRALAADLRTVAAAVELDLGDLADHGGPETWLGPAADAYRRGAAGIAEVGRAAARDTRGLARAIDARAAQQEALLTTARADADPGGRGEQGHA